MVMKNLYLLLLFSWCAAAAQNNLNLALVSNLDYADNCNDIWGYVDGDGVEYAIIGTRNSTSIVSLEDPANPVEVANIPGVNSPWRDIKTHDHFAYVTADRGTDGLLIIDLSTLPDSVSHTFWKPRVDISGFPTILQTCHNLYLDSGYVYLAGCNISNQGVLIVDVNEDPMNPQVMGAADLTYAHDAFVRDNILFASEIFEGNLGIYDVSDKSDPKLIITERTSSAFTHNAWSSDDNKYAFTTDERSEGFVDAYDISNTDQIRRLDRYQSLAVQGQGVIPHNTHYHNGFLVTSWYTEGVIVIDANKPDNLVRVGQYDTWLGGDGGFNGCWGAYPFLPSGLILTSDITSGLYVLEPDYQRVSYMEGSVIDQNTQLPINQASINILSNDANAATSDALGEYRTGQATSGNFLAIASHREYESDTMEIRLVSGETIMAMFELRSKTKKTITGSISDAVTGEPIAGAQIRFASNNDEFLSTSDENGNYSLEVFEGQFEVFAGKLGFITQALRLTMEDGNAVHIALERGLMDDFNFDFGWKVDSEALTGVWERGIPVGTILEEDGALSNPNADLPDDIGAYAYVTGNGGGIVGFDDVAGGSTTLFSPVLDLTDYEDPQIEYSLWFYNSGGDSPPDDLMQIILSDGPNNQLVEEIRDDTNASGRWREKSIISVNNHFADLSNIQLSIRISDDGAGHIVEGGFDGFAVVEGETTATEEEVSDIEISISPNPFIDLIAIESSEKMEGYSLIDASGKIVISSSQIFDQRYFTIKANDLPTGTYFIELSFEKGGKKIEKLVKL